MLAVGWFCPFTNLSERCAEVAVITRFIVVRNGIELDQIFTDKKEAEAYDKMLDAAQDLAALIKQGDLPIDMDAKIIDDISIYLSKNAPAVVQILKSVKPIKPVSKDVGKSKAAESKPEEDKKPAREPRSKAKSKTNL
jgi:dsDNA-binding SOS-regulon protein